MFFPLEMRYATSEWAVPGQFLHCKATKYSQEFFVIHPDDEIRLLYLMPDVHWLKLNRPKRKRRKKFILCKMRVRRHM